MLRLSDGHRRATVGLKLEGASGFGSIKHRTARGLLTALERAGRLKVGDTIIESTSGNLGVALASLAQERGYQFVAVGDPNMTVEFRARLKSLGAVVEIIDELDEFGGYLLSRLAHVRDRLDRHPDWVWPNQYDNHANPSVHCLETAPELMRQIGERPIDAVFVAVSTGGTLRGIADYFREASPRTRLVAVDVRGSVALGGAPGARYLSGIGAGRRSSFLRPRDYDVVMRVDEFEAVRFCRYMANVVGTPIGASTGAVLAAAALRVRFHPQDSLFACLSPDGADSYLSTVYDDDWVRRVFGTVPAADDLAPVTMCRLED